MTVKGEGDGEGETEAEAEADGEGWGGATYLRSTASSLSCAALGSTWTWPPCSAVVQGKWTTAMPRRGAMLT